MKKLIIEEKFKKARQILEKNEAMQLEMGTTEYSNVLEKIIKDLQTVKASLRTRSVEGAKYRKESDRIQSAISAIKYLNNKSRKMINSEVLRESDVKEGSLTRGDIKHFLKTFR